MGLFHAFGICKGNAAKQPLKIPETSRLFSNSFKPSSVMPLF